MINRSDLFIIIILSFIFSESRAQNISDRDRINRVDYFLNQPGLNFHTALKPYRKAELDRLINYDSILSTLDYAGDNKILNQLLNRNVAAIHSGKLMLYANPVLNALPGTDLTQTRFLNEFSAGADFNILYSDKWQLNYTYLNGASVFPAYLDSFASVKEVIPGYGNIRKHNSLHRYFYHRGSISYAPSSHFDLQAGFDRSFIGEGYRSLLLSDDAYNYPFLKFTTRIWKFQYTNLYAAFDDIRGGRDGLYSKYGTFHYLSWDISQKVQLGIFESVIFESRDSTRWLDYDVHYLNPVIFYRPVEYSIGSGDNVLMGLNLKVNFYKNNIFYAQVMIDEFLLKEIRADAIALVRPDDTTLVHGWWANKYGFQAGVKLFNLLGIQNLNAQTEYNYVRPYSYTHGSINQSYGHYNLFLAHPLSANFKESISFLRYYYKRFSFEAKYMYAEYGEDIPDIFFGRDIYTSYTQRPYEHGHYTTQGIKSILNIQDFKISYLINPAANIMLEAGFFSRSLNRADGMKQRDNFIYAGIRTTLFNGYRDR